MFTTRLTPRFKETDALGHINNAVLPTWFEEGRVGIFEIFNPSLSLERWNLILRRTEIDFLAQIHLGADVSIETRVAKIGNTSVTIAQTAFQKGVEVARSIAVMVHFDYETQSKTPIPDQVRTALEEHLA